MAAAGRAPARVRGVKGAAAPPEECASTRTTSLAPPSSGGGRKRPRCVALVRGRSCPGCRPAFCATAEEDHNLPQGGGCPYNAAAASMVIASFGPVAQGYGPIIAGALFGAGWWFWVDAVVCTSHKIPFPEVGGLLWPGCVEHTYRAWTVPCHVAQLASGWGGIGS